MADFQHYPQWNPFIKEVSGKLAEGETLSILITPSGKKCMRFSSTLIKVEENHEIRWVGGIMLKNILRGFLPWILYFILIGKTPAQLNLAISVAAATTILLEIKSLKKGFILSWGTLIFFIFLYVAVVVMKNQWIAQYEWVFSNGTLALIAWGSLAIRCPFTIQYAKEQVPEEKWQHPTFIKINVILTAVWGCVFLIGLGLHILRFYFPSAPASLAEVISYLPSIFGIWFTSWFPNWYRQKQINII